MTDIDAIFNVLLSSNQYMNLFENNRLEKSLLDPKAYQSCATRLNLAVGDEYFFQLFLMITDLDPDCDILEVLGLSNLITEDRKTNCPVLDELIGRLTTKA